jgi:ABC-type multidrug transport system fused ATPase/permease subunit
VVVALLFVYLVVLGKPFAGVVVTIMLFYRLVQKVLQMQHGWQAFSSCLGGIQTYDRTFAEVSSRPERAGWRAIGGLQHGIELQDVSLRLGETMVLADVSLAIPRRQAVALVGESGAGKTSVVDLVTGVLKPTSGRVLVDGVDLGEIDLAAWRRRIGYVTQETVVFNDTLANNITLWAESSPETEGRLQAAVQATGLAEVAAAERGLDTVVGDRGIKLSGGQRQRLAIARELFRQPDLLILDEATSALDAETERGVRDHIEALRGRVTLLVIGHRLETIRNCDWIYVLSKGTVVESGPFARLVEDRSSYLHQCAGEMDS